MGLVGGVVCCVGCDSEGGVGVGVLAVAAVGASGGDAPGAWVPPTAAELGPAPSDVPKQVHVHSSSESCALYWAQ